MEGGKDGGGGSAAPLDLATSVSTAQVAAYTRGVYTVCPRSSDPFYIVGYYIKWVTTSWTYSTACPLHCVKFSYTHVKILVKKDILYFLLLLLDKTLNP